MPGVELLSYRVCTLVVLEVAMGAAEVVGGMLVGVGGVAVIACVLLIAWLMIVQLAVIVVGVLGHILV